MLMRILGLVLVLCGGWVLSAGVIGSIESALDDLGLHGPLWEPATAIAVGLVLAVYGSIILLRTKRPSEKIAILGSSK